MIETKHVNIMDSISIESVTVKLRQRQFEIEAQEALVKAEMEIEIISKMFEEEEEPQIETIEELQIELAMTPTTYKGITLDSSINIIDWLNEHLVEILPAYDSLNDLVESVNASIALIASTFITALGINIGSEYQKQQKQYVELVELSFKLSLNEDLEHELRKSRLFDFYTILLDYIKSNIALEPLGANESDLVFNIDYDELRRCCRYHKMYDNSYDRTYRDKLESLCDLGLLTNLSRDSISPKALARVTHIAEGASKSISERVNKKITINIPNFYVLNDLSPSIQKEAIRRLQDERTYGLRKKDRTGISLELVHGAEIKDTIVAQSTVKVNYTTFNNYVDAANILLEENDYFTEEQLRIQYCKKNRHIKAKDSRKEVKIYLAGTVKACNCKKVRVCNDIKEQYSLPAKIKSNSFIYVAA